MPIIETVVIHRRVPIDPAAPVIPPPIRAWQDVRYGVPYYWTPVPPPAPPPVVPPTTPGNGGNGTIPVPGTIPGELNQIAGPYAFPLTEIGVGAFFAVNQIQHVFERVAPGAAQLWSASNSSPTWHVIAALAGLAAAIHGISTIVKLIKAKKKTHHP